MIIGKIKDNMQDSLKAYNLHFVSSPNSEKEISRLESECKFKAGDEGFVHPVKYDRKLHFKPFPNGKYRTWVKKKCLKSIKQLISSNNVFGVVTTRNDTEILILTKHFSMK